ncbi:MAG: CdaR family protein, partial [bacterium]
MKKRLINNYPIKLLSLALAVILWLYVNSEQAPKLQTEIPVKLKYVNLPPQYITMGAPNTITVKLAGEPGVLAAVVPGKLTAIIDLTGLSEGRHRVPVKVVNQTGANLTQKYFFVELKLKKLKKIEKAIDIAFFGSLPTGLVMGKVNYKQKKADIYGEEKR